MAATLDAELFRKLFPEFADDAAYPEPVLAARWTEATGYVSAETSPCGLLSEAKRGYALQCLTAHLLRLAKVIAQAGTGEGMTGVVIQATIDKVSVMLQAPPSRGEWGHWLAQTPYGQQLASFLAAQAAGGFYIGGSAVRGAFR
jgi:hypothetical protein